MHNPTLSSVTLFSEGVRRSSWALDHVEFHQQPISDVFGMIPRSSEALIVGNTQNSGAFIAHNTLNPAKYTIIGTMSCILILRELDR